MVGGVRRGAGPTRAGWCYADVWEVVAEQLPAAPALVHGDRRRSWSDFDRRANGVAAALLDAGLARQDKVAQYLYNSPEYLESLFGIFKAGLVPVNTNYRYTENELHYLWNDCDAAAVVFHGTFTETIERIRDRLPGIGCWLWVDDGSAPCPPWATAYESVADRSLDRVQGPWGRSGNDVFLLYTGGTTGMPKGVMWRQDDLFWQSNAAAKVKFSESGSLAEVEASIRAPGPVILPASPLMHGTGLIPSFSAMSSGGSVVTLVHQSFDAVELLDAVQRERVQYLAIVGDAFARPILRELDAAPDRWDVSSLRVVLTSGVMMSAESKAAMLRYNPRLAIVDGLGSSEASGLGLSVTSAATGPTETGRFRALEDTVVVTEDGRLVEPGSGEIGLLARRGRLPLGYYNDPAKTAATFRVIGGERFSIPGDYATIEADGTLALLGRGSICINTGGEKVFPEEVEEALKTHAGVRDAIVVGVADDRLGESVNAIVEPEGDAPSEAELIAHVKRELAGYKAPRRIHMVDTIGRAANGKADYRGWRVRVSPATT